MPLITLQEKEKYLMQAFEEKWVLVFEHDPVIGAGTVQKTEKGFIFGQSAQFE
jgi:hypothetical protein